MFHHCCLRLWWCYCCCYCCFHFRGAAVAARVVAGAGTAIADAAARAVATDHTVADYSVSRLAATAVVSAAVAVSI